MDYLTHIHAISLELSLLFLRGCGLFFSAKICILSLNIVFILHVANKANPGELLPFYLGLELFANSILNRFCLPVSRIKRVTIINIYGET